jgi:hypothetical protein
LIPGLTTTLRRTLFSLLLLGMMRALRADMYWESKGMPCFAHQGTKEDRVDFAQ